MCCRDGDNLRAHVAHVYGVATSAVPAVEAMRIAVEYFASADLYEAEIADREIGVESVFRHYARERVARFRMRVNAGRVRDVVCAGCGDVFTTVNRRKKYCTRRCKNRIMSRIHRSRNPKR